MIKDSQAANTFLKNFLRRVANLIVALAAGFVGYFVSMGFVVQVLFNPDFDLPPYGIFGSRIPALVYAIELLGFVVCVIVLIKTFRKFNESIRKERMQPEMGWVEQGKKYFSIGFWIGICWGFLFPLVMQILFLR